MSGAAPPAARSAVVFAYHNVGVRCLRAVLDAGIEVRLVVTHADNPTEAIWFDSVARFAADHGLACLLQESASAADLQARCELAAPDFLFSFYFRRMLPAALLAVARRGAFNLHGSLLPRYRGRAPVNWAVLNGERETGATLHVMDAKPDHGDIVDQLAVPILGDDTARHVFDKVTVAAELVMVRTLPRLIDGTARCLPQRHVAGQYFGGRGPEDGRIPATASARSIHDLVRAVAPPDYPGAFFDAGGHRVLIARTLPAGPQAETAEPSGRFSMASRDGVLWIEGADGHRLRVLEARLDGRPADAAAFEATFGPGALSPDL